ncbi:MAG: KamA family radical SAM protein [Bacteroidetes bacterium]|nr:KamA family radical SAM protein [Bacteroidota bacterium]
MTPSRKNVYPVNIADIPAVDITELKSRPEWSDWKWQLRNRIRTAEELARWINLTDSEIQAIEATKAYFRWQITPYYASLMDRDDPTCPVRRQVVPQMDEMDDDFDILSLDPLEELAHSPVKNLVHNYNDRVAFCVAAECAVYCRYCLRKRMVGDGEYAMNKTELQEGIDYIAAHPEIRDVLLTGGDPMILNDANLEWILSRLRAIPHVELIRIGTRFPVLNPYRFTPEFCEMIGKYHPVWINTHYNHPKELTADAALACDRITRAGAPLGNQTVLLKGINNNADVLKTLFKDLVKMRVRPYYLYQAQLIGGTRHFRTTIEEGMELMEQLRGRISGFAIPTYVLDTPHGKVPLTPNGFKKRDGEYIEVQAYGGEIWREYNPEG